MKYPLDVLYSFLSFVSCTKVSYRACSLGGDTWGKAIINDSLIVSIPAGLPWLESLKTTEHTASGRGVHWVCGTGIVVDCSMSSVIERRLILII